MPKPAEFQQELSLQKGTPSSSAGAKVIKRLKETKGDHSVAVGLSGGVDSSLTAALLVQADWAVEGITLWLMSGKGSCCSDGLIDAAGICDQLGIPHHVIDSRKTFEKEIIEGLIEGYKQGITPIPCSRCNRSVKFSEMLNWANNERKITNIATGHYARIRKANENLKDKYLPGDPNGRHKLLRGLDSNKDQSYFLYDLTQDVLSKVIFPLGELTKEDTRNEALKLGLRTAKKPESQDLCLAEHHGSMKDFLDAYIPPQKGQIILKNGTVLGEHDGIEHFTIGQRKGLGISWKEPLHVIHLDASSNKVIVATREEAGKSICIVNCVNWVSINPPKEAIKAEVQIRYRSAPVKADLIPLKPKSNDISNKRPYRCKLVFEKEQFSIAPGQAAVFYCGEFLLGGGLIES